MPIQKKLTRKEEINLLMLGFLYGKKAVTWQEILDACIMGRGTITPCLNRLCEHKLLTKSTNMVDVRPQKTFTLTEKGEKKFLESVFSKDETYLILDFFYPNVEAQKRVIREALILKIEEGLLSFAIDMLCKQRLLGYTKATDTYFLTLKGKELYLKKRFGGTLKDAF